MTKYLGLTLKIDRHKYLTLSILGIIYRLIISAIMSNIIYKSTQSEDRIRENYRFEKVDDRRWGIYVQDRLLATIGSYEACKSISESLSQDKSYTDALKAAIAYKKSINRSLIIG